MAKQSLKLGSKGRTARAQAKRNVYERQARQATERSAREGRGCGALRMAYLRIGLLQHTCGDPLGRRGRQRRAKHLRRAHHEALRALALNRMQRLNAFGLGGCVSAERRRPRALTLGRRCACMANGHGRMRDEPLCSSSTSVTSCDSPSTRARFRLQRTASA
eukprot:1443419-Pleurochrysis_carterae.AAC.2